MEPGETEHLKRAILILGGDRSGKSALAQRMVEEMGPSPVYLATARIEDEEMAERVAIHKLKRGSQWETIEEPLQLSDVIKSIPETKSAILLDCLTLWLANLLFTSDEQSLLASVQELINSFSHLKTHLIMVSNEVGMGIVPENAVARKFRDLSGTVNQMVAAAAHEVFMAIAGLPLRLK